MFTTRARATTTTYRVLAPRRTIGGRRYAAVQTPHRTVVTLPQQPPDTTAPDTAITSGPSTNTQATHASFGFTGSDDRTPAAGLVFECNIDGSGWSVCTSPASYDTLGLGQHGFAVRAVDAAGNVDPTPAEREWTVVEPPPSDPPFVTAVGGNGRYLVDQHGDAILVKGDSPWAILHEASPEEMDAYISTRAAQGFNVVLLSLLGNGANGGRDDGTTFDGIEPFVGGDESLLNDAYWDRVEHFISRAGDAGITVMAYPIDGWAGTSAYGGLAGSWSTADARSYGEAVGARLADHPNLIWAVGGDYIPEPVANERFNGVLSGLAAADPGRDRITTIQFQPNQTSLDDPYWDEKVDFSFVYSYALTYAVVERAYLQTNPAGSHLPALMSEAHYEEYPGVTDRYIRSMAAWALTSGSPGEFYGSENIWDEAPTPANMNTTAVEQLSAMRAAFESLDGWEHLVPDHGSAFVVGGRGTKGGPSAEYFSGNTYVTGARTPDGTLAVVYLPDANRTITIDEALMGDGYTARWVDPTTGTGPGAVEGSTYQRPVPNAAGGPDWLLVLESDSPAAKAPSAVEAVATPRRARCALQDLL